MTAHPQRAASSETFAAVFEQYAAFVLRAMRHLGIPPADLQDQCQEVFVGVFKGLSAFGERSTLQTWIYGICVRVASNHRRRAHVRRERPVSEPPEQESPLQPDELVEREQARPRLQRLLDSLEPEQRAVFVLYEIEELSMKRVAEACGCPLQTAYSRLHAARRVLLARYQEAEGPS